MPLKKRHWTDYPGVYWISSTAVGSNKLERVYYIKYRRNGKAVEEKAGRQFQNDMSPARAAALRVRRIQGEPSNKERREREREIPKQRWSIAKLFDEFQSLNPHLKALPQDRSHFKHLEPLICKEPQEISAIEIDSLKNSILKTKSSQTCKLALALLRRIVRWGVKRNLCQPLSFTLDLPKVNNTVTEFLTSKQISKLLEVIGREPNDPAGAMMKIALFSGLRRGELFRLTWADIDFKNGFINIRNPKGGRDQIIPLNHETRLVLNELERTESAYVFPGLNGGQRAEIRRGINRIKRDAGLPDDFRPLHGLRHTYASLLASSGKVDLYTLQHLLTHKHPETTQRYAHLRDDSLRRASNILGELIPGGVKQGRVK